MSRGVDRVPTPPRMRNLALACVFLATVVGLFSTVEAMNLDNLSELRERIVEENAAMPFVDPQITAAMAEAQMMALEGMKTPRAFVLAALAVCCMVAWMSATRLIRPDGLPREGIRKMLAGSLIVAAFLRTIDGAQSLVIAQRGVAAAMPYLVRQPDFGDPQAAEFASKLFSLLILGGVVATTAVMAGGMLMLGQYFRSEKVKQVVSLQDQQLEE